MSYPYYSRWQERNIHHALDVRRVLVLAGARQCGKTTLAKQFSKANGLYRTLDDITLLHAALEDPKGFVHHGNELMVIDEIQRAPLLLQAIKHDVDEQTESGRFLLTGSAHLPSLPGTRESLAGRVHTLRLRPLAMGELYQLPPPSLTSWFEGKWEDIVHRSHEISLYRKDTYITDALRGGYPEALRLKKDTDRRQWYRDYMNALIERDLQDVAHISKKPAMHTLVEMLAAWSSKFFNITSLGTSLSLARVTVETYIHALEALYIIERVRPWRHTDYDRAGKQDKWFMTDTGLMAALLGWQFEKVRFIGDLHGKLLETFVFNQLSAVIDAQEAPYRLYHYRDNNKREIDFILENEAGDVIGIEVKAGSVISSDTFKHLRWFRDNLAQDRAFKAIVFYTGETIASFGEGMWAIPMRYLWS